MLYFLKGMSVCLHSWQVEIEKIEQESTADPLFKTIISDITLMERKLRMPQIQGVQGRSRNNLLRALGNEGDGVSSAFPKGKQNGEKKEHL